MLCCEWSLIICLHDTDILVHRKYKVWSLNCSWTASEIKYYHWRRRIKKLLLMSSWTANLLGLWCSGKSERKNERESVCVCVFFCSSIKCQCRSNGIRSACERTVCILKQYIYVKPLLWVDATLYTRGTLYNITKILEQTVREPRLKQLLHHLYRAYRFMLWVLKKYIKV